MKSAKNGIFHFLTLPKTQNGAKIDDFLQIYLGIFGVCYMHAMLRFYIIFKIILLLSSMLYEQDYLHQTVSNRANVELVALVILTDRKNFHVLALVLGSRKCLKSSNRVFDANYAQVSG